MTTMTRARLLLLFVCAIAPGAFAQALLPENRSMAVERAYDFPRELPDFLFAGASADPDPRLGVSISYEHRELSTKLLTDVHLYRATRARMPSLALQEGLLEYLVGVRGTYANLDLELGGKSRAVSIARGGQEWPGKDHAFEFKTHDGTPSRSYTLLFYDSGHLIKFRGSTPRKEGLSARKLRKIMNLLAQQFLQRMKIVEPYGQRCGPPEFVDVDANDPRARTFSAGGHEFYLPRGLDEEAAGKLIGSAMKQSMVAALEAGCLGDDIRLETKDD